MEQEIKLVLNGGITFLILLFLGTLVFLYYLNDEVQIIEKCPEGKRC